MNELARVRSRSSSAKPAAFMSLDLIKKVAMDIGKEVASHIETMYPNAVAATSRNMPLSVRNCTYNNIIAALDLTDEDAVRARLKRRRRHRREMKKAWTDIHTQEGTR